MMDGDPPYKALLTHGFVVDGYGRKMSKSKGNVIAPQEVSNTLGADILRLWVAATDYSGELSIPGEILKRVVECVSAPSQHAALPARQHLPTSIPKHCLPVDEWSRSIATRSRDARRRSQVAVTRRTTGTTSSTSSHRSCRPSARKTSAVSTSTSSRTGLHDAAPTRCTSRRAERALPYYAEPHAPARAHPVLHCSRGVGSPQPSTGVQRLRTDVV